MLLEKFVKTWQFDDSWTLNGDTPLESPVRIGEKNHISLWDISISGKICKFCWFFSIYFHFRQYLQILLIFFFNRCWIVWPGKCAATKTVKVQMSLSDIGSCQFCFNRQWIRFSTFRSLKNKKLTSCPKSTQVPKYTQKYKPKLAGNVSDLT